MCSSDLAVDDPRVPLGEAIGRAEADDGTLVFEAKREGAIGKVTVKLPALGAYRLSWPANCPKSRAIIANNAKYIAASQQENGSYRFGNGRAIGNNLQGCLASLFLLSTGEAKYLPNVERHVRPLAKLAETRKNAGGHINWQLGYQGILLSEYYLRTGDKQVLPGLQAVCNWCADHPAPRGRGHGARARAARGRVLCRDVPGRGMRAWVGGRRARASSRAGRAPGGSCECCNRVR